MPARHRRRFRREIPPGRRERRLDPGDELVVVDGSGDGDHEVLRSVVGPVVRPDGLAPDGLDRGGAAPDGPPERVVAEDGLEQPLPHDIRRIVVGRRELLEDDPAFALELLGVENRRGDHVGQHGHGHRQVDVAHLGVVTGVLLRGQGVVLSAHLVEAHGDVEGRAGRGALEQQMLEEVGGAVGRRLLVARADRDPEADRRALRARHALAEDPHAAREDGAPHQRPAG
ncbi:hypothetical protein GCM10025881_35740 [Pseudolysinimonas kribbensis]|uniref:Uncharacterized protein n=1 Tax=Pseudolysinimonas kribbensis TaxID=433641 RepID=A0ABQ6K7W4_9MICO|nr:hypothetical protein GCM10025881_35740 [Pseudolysinimonas kribbensis]